MKIKVSLSALVYACDAWNRGTLKGENGLRKEEKKMRKITENRSFVILASLVIGVMFISGIAFTTAGPTKPHLILRYTKTLELDEGAEIWVYVRNPSNSLDRTGEEMGDLSEPLPNVEVNYLKMTIINPDGSLAIDPWIFYPNGDVLGGWVGTPEEPDPEWEGDIPWYVEEIEHRFEPIIHPGETALVYYGGWSAATDPGVMQFTYELNVEFEGMTYNLVKTVRINSR